MEASELFASMFSMGIFAGVIVIYMAMRQRSQQLEMQHRERMAMIERGQVPIDQPQLHGPSGPPHLYQLRARSDVGARFMSLGIIVVAFGLGLMSIISIAGGAPEAGVGIGGAIVILGVAFIANSLVSRNTVPDAPRHPGVTN